MYNVPSDKILAEIPKLGEQDGEHTRDTMIYLHFFIGGCDWYVAEYDGKDTFFGYAIINHDLDMAEWGYFSFSELKSLKLSGVFEVDCESRRFFPVQKADNIKLIVRGGVIW